MATIGERFRSWFRKGLPGQSPEADVSRKARQERRLENTIERLEKAELSAEQQGIVEKVVELMKKEGKLTSKEAYDFFKQISDIRLIVRKELMLLNTTHRQILLDIDKEKLPNKEDLRRQYNEAFRRAHANVALQAKAIFQDLTSVDSVQLAAEQALGRASLAQALVKEYYDLKRQTRATFAAENEAKKASRDVDGPAEKAFAEKVKKMEAALNEERKVMQHAVSTSIIMFTKERRGLEARRQHLALLIREQGFPSHVGKETVDFLDGILHGINEQMHREEENTRTTLGEVEQLKPAGV